LSSIELAAKIKVSFVLFTHYGSKFNALRVRTYGLLLRCSAMTMMMMMMMMVMAMVMVMVMAMVMVMVMANSTAVAVTLAITPHHLPVSLLHPLPQLLMIISFHSKSPVQVLAASVAVTFAIHS
jgi:hypothetical protein